MRSSGFGGGRLAVVAAASEAAVSGAGRSGIHSERSRERNSSLEKSICLIGLVNTGELRMTRLAALIGLLALAILLVACKKPEDVQARRSKNLRVTR